MHLVVWTMLIQGLGHLVVVTMEISGLGLVSLGRLHSVKLWTVAEYQML